MTTPRRIVSSLSHVLAALALAAMTLAPVATPSADASELQARRGIERAQQAFIQKYNITPVHSAFGLAPHQGFVTTRVFLVAGIRHSVFASGCGDLFNLGIRVFDPNGNMISHNGFIDSRDSSYKPWRNAFFRANMTGLYTIQIQVFDNAFDGSHTYVVLGINNQQ